MWFLLPKSINTHIATEFELGNKFPNVFENIHCESLSGFLTYSFKILKCPGFKLVCRDQLTSVKMKNYLLNFCKNLCKIGR